MGREADWLTVHRRRHQLRAHVWRVLWRWVHGWSIRSRLTVGIVSDAHVWRVLWRINFAHWLSRSEARRVL